MIKNRERRKEVGHVFFDLSKYLLTTVAIGGLLTEKTFDIKSTIIAIVASLIAMIVAYYIYPLDRED